METETKQPAIKIFTCMLEKTRLPAGADESLDVGETRLVFLGLEFVRVWIQGIVVDVDRERRIFVLDDGTGTISVLISPAEPQELEFDDFEATTEHELPDRGAYVLLVGSLMACVGDERSTCRRYRLICDVLKDVGLESPNRDIHWQLEVIDYWKSRERYMRKRKHDNKESHS